MHKSLKPRSGIILLTICLIMGLFVSCEDPSDKKIIIGQWTGIEWMVNGTNATYNPAEAVFTFDDQGNYSFTYAGNTEKGKYFISNRELFTTPDGGIKMMVRVPTLTQDTMIFDMNRGGQSERLTLLRQ